MWQHEKLLQEHMKKFYQQFECGNLDEQEEEKWEVLWSKMKMKEEEETWNSWGLGIISVLIIIWWQYHQHNLMFLPIEDEIAPNGMDNMTPLTLLHLSHYPESSALENFYNREVHSGVHEMNRGFEFVKVFTGNLLEACQSICKKESGVILKDGVGVGSTFEKWGWKKEPTFDVLVPFHPPHGYTFQVKAACWQSDPNKRGCYVVSTESDFMFWNRGGQCSLHEKGNMIPLEMLLCTNRFLDTQKVHAWFHTLVGKAWRLICCRYDFTLTTVPSTSCKLKLVLKSGHMLYINFIPAVQRADSLNYLVNQATNMGDVSGIYWLESFSVYERQFLKLIRSFIPKNSCHLKCLSILAHLKKMTMPPNQCFLNSYHIKTSLMHLLIMLPPDAWHPENIKERIQDILYYLGQSLSKKRLDHFSIGNPSLPLDITIPQDHRRTEPINLLRPLLLEHRICAQANKEFQAVISLLACLNTEGF
ncbi:inositol 1,4,5-trisphosphate receptor-interacting protein-like 1 [Pleurodeles waltl]|uniref:inositol 1,4,5-trisphosphate receptor-interacting protein-like 1 n=1 Tax=Pleurodeles waltl TaxID=8319 RepID=UPI003709C032